MVKNLSLASTLFVLLLVAPAQALYRCEDQKTGEVSFYSAPIAVDNVTCEVYESTGGFVKGDKGPTDQEVKDAEAAVAREKRWEEIREEREKVRAQRDKERERMMNRARRGGPPNR